jgi:glycosyltransferase involved in cell wall biosynthesis
VPDYLAAADVFVTASVSEVHPLVIMEAFAAGLPAIGVHSPGVGDIVEDGVTGFLTSEDAGAFAARITEIATDPSCASVSHRPRARPLRATTFASWPRSSWPTTSG